MQITVLGCGYLGATHSACMAALGHQVIGVETDPERLESLRAGRVPFFEPELEELLDAQVAAGALRFTDSYEEAGAFGEVHFLCVGTPQEAGGLGADLSQVHAAIGALGPHLRHDALVVGKSTVPVGTAADLADRLAALAPGTAQVDLAWNPEFLREGHAVADTVRPDRLVFGVREERSEQRLREVYAEPIAEGSPVVVTDLATAELVKVAANAFLATKVSFINAMADLCDATGADVTHLADALGHDARIGRQFLNAGIGFGGGCLPKDIRAFQHRAGELGVGTALSFLHEMDEINLARRHRVVDLAEELLGAVSGARVAVLGAAFKPHSDDIRDSPALEIAGRLHLEGADVRVFDPKAMESAARRFPTLTYAESASAACLDVDLVLHLTEWPEFRELDPAELATLVRHPRVIDGRNCLDVGRWRAAGWTVRSMGRP